MTQEEKQLLLIDLCARLPYGVKINIKSDYTREMEDTELTPYHLDGLGYNAEYRNLHPYLRPMSSMTEKEKIEYCDLQDRFLCSAQYPVTDAYEIFDWLNSHYFDYRRLIDKGLALEAPKDMYKTE